MIVTDGIHRDWFVKRSGDDFDIMDTVSFYEEAPQYVYERDIKFIDRDDLLEDMIEMDYPYWEENDFDDPV